MRAGEEARLVIGKGPRGPVEWPVVILALALIVPIAMALVSRPLQPTSPGASPTDLSAFPYPFVADGRYNSTFVLPLGLSHGPASAGRVEDSLGALVVGASMAREARGFPMARLDTDVAQVNDGLINVSQGGNLILFGGSDANLASLHYHGLAGSRGFPLGVAAGQRVCTTRFTGTTVNCYHREGSFGQGRVVDYGYATIILDSPRNRYVLEIGGLDAPAGRAEAELVALRAPSVLKGTGTITEFVDDGGDGTFDSYRVVDGTGGAVTMEDAAAMALPEGVAATIVVGEDGAHGVAKGGGSTLDVLAGLPLAVREARRHNGPVWASVDTEVSPLDASALRTGYGDIVSVGARRENLVTRYLSDRALVPIRVVAGCGISPDGGACYLRVGDYFAGAPVLDYGFRAEADAGRVHIEVVAGTSGFATRAIGALSALGAGTVNTGTGAVVALNDQQGDGVYESFKVVDGTGEATLMDEFAAMPTL